MNTELKCNTVKHFSSVCIPLRSCLSTINKLYNFFCNIQLLCITMPYAYNLMQYFNTLSCILYNVEAKFIT